MRFTCSVRTHVGHVREINEDSGVAGPSLLLVADGVGGAAAGEIASASTSFILTAMSIKPSGLLSPDQPDVLEGLGKAIDAVYDHLCDGVSADPARAGMATTLTAVLTNGTEFGLAHIGDSRAYLLRAGLLTRLTTDHTFVQALIDDGQLAPDRAATHPLRSAVTRFLGADERHRPDLIPLDLRVGDRLLLCSDGLTDFVPEDRIRSLLGDRRLDAATQGLVAAALDASGADNVTCVVGDVDAGDLHNWSRRIPEKRGAVEALSNLIDPVAGVAG